MFTKCQTSRGNPAIRYKSFLFRKDRALVTGDISWRCTSKECKASIKTDEAITDIKEVLGKHTHRSDNDGSPPRYSSSGTDGALGRNGKGGSVQSAGDPSATSTPTPGLNLRLAQLQEENEILRRKIEVKQIQWDAAINRSIEMECRINGLKMTDASTQTYTNEFEIFEVGVQTDLDKEVVSTPSKAVSSKESQTTDIKTRSQYSDCKLLTVNHIDDLASTITLREKTIRILNENNNALYREVEVLETEIEDLKKLIRELEQQLKEKLNSFQDLASQDASIFVENNDCVGPEHIQRSWDVGKLFVLADSHGRDIVRIMSEGVFPAGRITGSIHPGAPLRSILDDYVRCRELAKMNKSDYIVIIGGSNSITESSCQSDIELYIESVRLFISNFAATNIIISTIPYRYDLRENSRVNRLIKELNIRLRKFCSQNSVDVIEMWDLQRALHTRHGLHLNRRGKSEIVSRMKLILEKSVKNLYKILCNLSEGVGGKDSTTGIGGLMIETSSTHVLDESLSDLCNSCKDVSVDYNVRDNGVGDGEERSSDGCNLNG